MAQPWKMVWPTQAVICTWFTLLPFDPAFNIRLTAFLFVLNVLITWRPIFDVALVLNISLSVTAQSEDISRLKFFIVNWWWVWVNSEWTSSIRISPIPILKPCIKSHLFTSFWNVPLKRNATAGSKSSRSRWMIPPRVRPRCFLDNCPSSNWPVRTMIPFC